MEYNSHCCFFWSCFEKIPAEPLNSQKVDLLKYIVQPLENISLIGTSSFPVKDCSVLRSSSWEGSSIVPYLLWHGASVNTVSSQGPVRLKSPSSRRVDSSKFVVRWVDLVIEINSFLYNSLSRQTRGLIYPGSSRENSQRENNITKVIKEKDVLWDVRKTVPST